MVGLCVKSFCFQIKQKDPTAISNENAVGLLNFVFFIIIIIGGIKFGVRRMVFYAPKRLLVYRTPDHLVFSILLGLKLSIGLFNQPFEFFKRLKKQSEVQHYIIQKNKVLCFIRYCLLFPIFRGFCSALVRVSFGKMRFFGRIAEGMSKDG